MTEPLGRIGRYELVEVLGRGAIGVVYRGFDSLLDRTVAVKVYHQHVALADELRRRFELEVKASSKLHHPNIVVVYDGGLENDTPFIAMEFVEGSSLAERLKKRGKLAPREALGVLGTIAEALAYAHRQGVVHRDLKPANILLSATGQPKIADFSVAKLMSAESTMGLSPMGTPTHMAPEQIAGKPVDPRTDIFALGILAYELLTGRRPFSGEHATAVIYNIMNLEPPPPSEIEAGLPRAVDGVIARALAKDPAARTADAATFARELRDAFEGRPAPAPPDLREPLGAPAAEWRDDDDVHEPLGGGDFEAFRDLASRRSPAGAGRSRRAVFALQVFLVVAVALAGLYFLSRSRPGRELIEPLVAPAPEALGPATRGPEVALAPTRVPEPRSTVRRAPTAAPKPTPPPEPTATERPAPTPTAEPPPTPRRTAEEAARPREPIVPAVPVRPRREPPIAPSPPPGPEVDVAASVDVISKPPGADVLVDGRPVGRTPVRIRDLGLGTHEFLVRKDGHVSYRRTFAVEPRSTYEMNVTLAEVVNSLRVVSDPPGASITVNGVPRGTTPLLMDRLASGSYQVTARLAATVQTKEVDLEDGELAELRFSFEPAGE